ncbi:glycosyltransferase [Afifella sp. IM 167]|uniref:glycosyltransferase n=1 Tax=Afifella sp. IM 167 TaxID=2033586 RepID=UPI001CCF052C|nr:glycosyltransferase [Afifella sp. IM 167]
MPAGAPPPVFSLVIPAHNAVRYLGEALDSVFDENTRHPYEVIVVDDGSVDGTAALASTYPGVVCLRQENTGPSAARNAGIAAAKAGIVLFLDADDKVLPGRFDLELDQMRAEPEVAVTFGNWIVEGEPGDYLARYGLPPAPERFRELDNPFGRLMTAGCCVPTSTVAVRKTWLERVGGFPEDRRYAEDYAVWLKIAAAGGRFAYSSRALAWYRKGAASSLTRSSHTHAGLVLTLREALLSCGARLSVAERAVAEARYRTAVNGLLRHEWAYRGRRAALDRAQSLEPLIPRDLAITYRLLTLLPGGLPRLLRETMRARGRLALRGAGR